MKGAQTHILEGEEVIAIYHLGQSFRFERTGRDGDRIVLKGMQGHPLADKRGRLHAGRLILYRKENGSDMPRCHWCGFGMPWRDEERGLQGQILATFLDRDPSNLKPENVIGSCAWCNLGVRWGDVYPSEWQQILKTHAPIHPALRPRVHEVGADMGLENPFGSDVLVPEEMFNRSKIRKMPSRPRKTSEKAPVYRANSSRSRARKRGSHIHHEHDKKIEKVLHESASRIQGCLGIRIDVDHVYPLSRGGTHYHHNLRIMPASINTYKGSHLDDECRGIVEDIIKVWSSGKISIGRKS